MSNNRKPGFYWVKYKEWIVAEWDGTNWTVTHNCANYDDNDWDEIDERGLAKPVNDASALPIHSVSVSVSRCKTCGHPFTDDVCCKDCIDLKID